MGIVYDSAQRKQLLNFQQASHVLRRVEGENTDKTNQYDRGTQRVISVNICSKHEKNFFYSPINSDVVLSSAKNFYL